jgi:predicted transcriptional regulator
MSTMISDQLTQLSPAVINVYTQLVAFTEPASVDDIAQAAEAARSSTFKALVALEKRGLAERDRGIQNGPNRCPDLWRAPHTDHRHTPDKPRTPREPTQPTTINAPTSTPVANTTVPVTQPEEPTAHEKEDNPDTQNTKRGTSTTPSPVQPTEPSATTSPNPGAALPDGDKRLGPGCLRRLVLNHLNAHPGEAFTATRISRVIDRSSGAIANALTTLVKQGLTEQVTDRPRTYRAASPEPTA